MSPDHGYAQPGIGLISVGWMGKLHSRAYQAVPQVYPELKIRPRFVHAADTVADRADYAREVLGYARAGTDYRDVLADPDVDVVSICAPNMLHREIGVAAARAGKPFWIEKPVGRDAAETAAVSAAARDAGVTTSIGYNYRHVPAVERVRELIAAGDLGRITNVRAVFFNSYAAQPNGALSWRFRRARPAAVRSATCSATWWTSCSTSWRRSPRSARCCPPCTPSVLSCRWDRPRTSP